MSFNGNGARYINASEEQMYLTDVQLNAIAEKVADKVKPNNSEKFGLKSLSAIVGLVVLVGGILWGGGVWATGKAEVSDVVQLDKTLAEIKITLENITSTLSEIKKDIDDLENAVDKR